MRKHVFSLQPPLPPPCTYVPKSEIKQKFIKTKKNTTVLKMESRIILVFTN